MQRRIEDVEMLRGLAVLSVVIYHASDALFTWSTPGMARFYAYFSGGFGVDLFFAISGFVIARDIVPRLQETKGSFEAVRTTLAFWVRRAWRLWPSAWLWLVVILFASVVFNKSGAFGTFRVNFEAAIAAIIQVANLRFADAFMVREYGASYPYWSLSLEEQFYFVFPLIILLCRRWLPYLLVALVLYQLFSVRTLMGMSLRTDALALGVLIALWVGHPTYRMCQPNFLNKYLGAVLLVGFFICLGALSSATLSIVSIRVGLIAILSGLLVWIASYDRNFLFPPGCFKSVVSWIGSRSYAIYLIHVPAFLLTREIWFRLDVGGVGFGPSYFYPFILTSAGLILILSDLNYRLVETPLRLYGKKVAQRLQKGPVEANVYSAQYPASPKTE